MTTIIDTTNPTLYVTTLNNYSCDNKVKKYVIIDSRCRSDQVSSTSNFRYAFNSPITITKYCRLVYASIPSTFYLINSFNNTFVFNNNGTNLKVTLTPGNYDAAGLTNLLQNAIQDALGNANFTVTYNNYTNQLTFNYNCGLNGNYYQDFSQSTNDNDIYHFLGFPSASAFQLPLINGTLYQLTPPACVDLSGPAFINLYIPEIGCLNYNFSQMHSYLKTTFLLPIITAPNNINIITNGET